MSEASLADVLDMLKTMTSEMQTLKSDMAAMKDRTASVSGTADGNQTDRPRDHDFFPSHKKWDFPRFDGTVDPMLFLNKCEAYFRQHRTMAEERVRMASYHMDEVAQLWYIQLQDDEGTPSWGHFKDLLNLRFGPPLRSAPMFELADCRRTGTVEEYASRFQALLPRVGRLEEAQHVQLFTGGLLPPLSHAVRIHHPETLAAAISLARQVELMESDRLVQQPTRPAPRGPPGPAQRAALPATAPLLALPVPPAVSEPIVAASCAGVGLTTGGAVSSLTTGLRRSRGSLAAAAATGDGGILTCGGVSIGAFAGRGTSTRGTGVSTGGSGITFTLCRHPLNPSASPAHTSAGTLRLILFSKLKRVPPLLYDWPLPQLLRLPQPEAGT